MWYPQKVAPYSRLGAICLLGTLAAGLSIDDADARNRDRTASIDNVFDKWLDRRPRGDRNRIRITLGAVRGLTPPSRARGTLELELDSGAVTVNVKGLGQSADVWLVDNRSRTRPTLLPQAGDGLERLGELELQGVDSTLETTLTQDFLRSFQIDLVVVTSAGGDPLSERLLLGSASLFERRLLRRHAGVPEHDPVPGPVSEDPRVQLGLVSPQVLIGGELFFRGTFEGNGRTCGTCHAVDNNLVIDVQFIRQLRRIRPNDPLFVAEDGQRNQVPGLEIPQLMNRFGMILENVDGLENPTGKFLMRSVPHSLSVATSIIPPAADTPGTPGAPAELPDGTTDDVVQRNGWSGDGAPLTGSLRFFPVGAVIQHATRSLDRNENVDFRLPTPEELDAMEAYMLSVGRTEDIDLAQVALSDPRASNGQALFLSNDAGRCNNCHGNAGANSPFGGNRNFNTGTERVRLEALDRLDVPFDGGFGGQGLVGFDFDSDGDSVNDSYGNGTFNTPPLIEAADTGPFFHTNHVDTIEEAVAFYSTPAFNESPSGQFGAIALDDEQNRDIAAFLRVLNAAFNLGIAAQRLEAAAAMNEVQRRSGQADRVIDRLLDLAAIELRDALGVLRGGRVNRDAWRDIKIAINSSRHAIGSRSGRQRGRAIDNALEATLTARDALGEGLEFELGEGNLVF